MPFRTFARTARVARTASSPADDRARDVRVHGRRAANSAQPHASRRHVACYVTAIVRTALALVLVAGCCASVAELRRREAEAAQRTKLFADAALARAGLASLAVTTTSIEPVEPTERTVIEHDGKLYLLGDRRTILPDDLPAPPELATDARHRVYTIVHVAKPRHFTVTKVCGCAPPGQHPCPAGPLACGQHDVQILYGPLPDGATYGGTFTVEHETWDIGEHFESCPSRPPPP
jgi:hypothetical protein